MDNFSSICCSVSIFRHVSDFLHVLPFKCTNKLTSKIRVDQLDQFLPIGPRAGVNISAILWTGSDLRGAGPKYVPCKTRSVLLYVLEHQRVDNSSAGPNREKLVQLVDPDLISIDLNCQYIGVQKT
jgi:hypothetical protein